MTLKNVLAVALAAGALFAGTSAQALVAVTLDPSNPNTGAVGATVIDATEGAFQATGFLGSLDSVMNISSAVGVAGVVETGRIAVSDFQFNAANLNKNVAQNYNIFADFVLTGGGLWAGNVFNGSPLGATLTLTLGADVDFNGTVDMVLGTGSLDASNPIVAFAILAGGGQALTSFTATIDFTPAPGTTGPTGFFVAPTPFSVDIAAGNVGGNFQDTNYVVNGDGSVTITTVGGSGNFDFVENRVPEPSALLLAGLGLVAAGATARRRKQAAKA